MKSALFVSFLALILQPVAEAAPRSPARADFEGQVATAGCSGALVRFENSRDDDQGLVLTNGHCVGDDLVAVGAAEVDKPLVRKMRLLNAAGGVAGSVQSVKLVYATMTKTDIALLQLNETYSEILDKYQVRALTILPRSLVPGDAVQTISSKWGRIFTCRVETIVHQLKEDGYVWDRSIRLDASCSTLGPGTSGSPILLAGTRNVLGIVNTGNEHGESCTMSNPCEIDENANVSVHTKSGYGQQISFLLPCLGESNELDLSRNGCELPK